MNIVRRILLAVSLAGVLCAQEARPLYENNFEKSEIGKVPEEFLVLDGGFAVRQEGDNKFLELPGAPLETFGFLFGSTEKEGVSVAARIYGTAKGRRFPTFAVGLNGVGGFRLQVSPAKKLLELSRGDNVRAGVPYEWASGQWTRLRLQVRKSKEGAWKVEGKAWTEGAVEPAAWTISWDETEEVTAGRASIFGIPFSGTPIRFDDLVVAAAKN